MNTIIKKHKENKDIKFEKKFIGSTSFFIPTDDSLSDFIHWEFGDFFDDKIDTDDHNYMKECIINLIITTIKRNLTYELVEKPKPIEINRKDGNPGATKIIKEIAGVVEEKTNVN